MATQSFLNCKKQSLEKMRKYQLPNQFKKIGVGLAVLSFFSILINKFSLNLPELTVMAKYGMLLGLLMVSISKEKIEDELITQLRAQSYSFAFIVGVAYALLLPFVDYFVDVFLTNKEAVLKDMGDFEILWILLSVQVFYFAFLKRNHQ